MKQERKVLGILAIIFGALALLGSWMPIINNFSFILAILALIFGLIGFAVNRKRPKTLAIIGTVLAVVSIAIVLVTQAMYAKSLKELGKNVEETVSSVSSSIESSQKKKMLNLTGQKNSLMRFKLAILSTMELVELTTMTLLVFTENLTM